jgi:NAD(P)-dependent dehydrogenase (short-subunit alcohol dehydrogenase family)
MSDDRKHVIVTGAAGGIGSAVCARLDALGYLITPVDRAETVLNRPEGIRAELTNSAEVDAAVELAVSRQGTPWGLVHLVGTNIFKPLAELTDDDWHIMIDANLTSTFYFNRAVMPLMADAGGGRVVNMSSINGIRPEVDDSAYSAAKAGVVGLSRALAFEFASRQVAINCIAPGLTPTPRVMQAPPEFLDRQMSRIPMGRFGSVEELAATIAFLLSEEAGLYTGQIFTPNGGDWMP